MRSALRPLRSCQRRSSCAEGSQSQRTSSELILRILRKRVLDTMGNACLVPERIDANTARALIGNEKAYRQALARAPWVVSQWRAGRTITGSQAMEIWERERLNGGAKASLAELRSPWIQHDDDKDSRDFKAEARILKLEVQLSKALAEIRALRPLRHQGQELPVLRGQLRTKSEECERLRNCVVRLERQLREEKLDNAALRRHLYDRAATTCETKQDVSVIKNDDSRISLDSAAPSKDDSPSLSPHPTESKVSSNELQSVEKTVATLLIDYEDRGGDLRAAFQKWDATGDGELSAIEIYRGLRTLESFDVDHVTSDDIRALVKNFDTADSGHLSFVEFESFVATYRDKLQRKRVPRASSDADAPVSAPTQSSPLSDVEKKVAKLLIAYEDKGGDLASAFKKWDASGDGALSAAEIHNGLVKLKHGFEDIELDDVKALLKRFDRTNDGHLSLLEFESFVETCRDQLRYNNNNRLSQKADSGSPSHSAPLSDVEKKVAQLLIAYEDKGSDLATAFNKWDASGDGALSATEIHKGLVKLGHGFEEVELDDVKTLMKRFDKNSDGHLSLLEFESFVVACREQLGAHSSRQ